MSITVPSDIAHDIRQPVVGDSFGWSGLEPAAAKKSIVIHATASQAADEDGFVIANYHVNHNGWGGCGVHGVVTKDEYPGKPQFGLPAGAHFQYVGDLLTWRAGTVNQNPGRIHIEISGLFTAGNGIPSANQLRAVRKFIDWALSPNNVLPSLNYYSQVTYHNAVPGQNTACPGWNHPSFQAWFAYLQGGPFPEHLYAPAPVQSVPEPTPIPVQAVAPETPAAAPDLDLPGKGGVNLSEWRSTLREQTGDQTIRREGAVAVNVETGQPIENSRSQLSLHEVIPIKSYFDFNGKTYARTFYSTDFRDATHPDGLPNGIDVTYFTTPTGQASGEVTVSTPEQANPAPNPTIITDPTAVATGITDEELQQATVTESPKITIWQKLGELIASVAALLIKKRITK